MLDFIPPQRIAHLLEWRVEGEIKRPRPAILVDPRVPLLIEALVHVWNYPLRRRHLRNICVRGPAASRVPRNPLGELFCKLVKCVDMIHYLLYLFKLQNHTVADTHCRL